MGEAQIHLENQNHPQLALLSGSLLLLYYQRWNDDELVLGLRVGLDQEKFEVWQSKRGVLQMA